MGRYRRLLEETTNIGGGQNVRARRTFRSRPGPPHAEFLQIAANERDGAAVIWLRSCSCRGSRLTGESTRSGARLALWDHSASSKRHLCCLGVTFSYRLWTSRYENQASRVFLPPKDVRRVVECLYSQRTNFKWMHLFHSGGAVSIETLAAVAGVFGTLVAVVALVWQICVHRNSGRKVEVDSSYIIPVYDNQQFDGDNFIQIEVRNTGDKPVAVTNYAVELGKRGSGCGFIDHPHGHRDCQQSRCLEEFPSSLWCRFPSFRKYGTLVVFRSTECILGWSLVMAARPIPPVPFQ